MKQPYYCANDPTRVIWITDYEAYCVFNGMYIQSGLAMDDYMSLIDPKWPLY